MLLSKELESYLESIVINGKPDSKLPSEARLMQKYRVSRSTVRDVFKKLITKNMVYVLQGKGYFILNKCFWNKVYSFKEKNKQNHNKLYVVDIPLDDYFIENYQLLVEDFQSLIKVRYHDNEIKKYSIIWVNKTILKNLNYKACEDSLLEYISSRKIKLINNFNYLCLELPNILDKKYLRLNFKTYLPRKYSLSFSEYSEVIECSKETYQPEKFEFYRKNYF
ncbi:GntR family transcriptional regulator [Spiroplasma melliferum]|uniref:Transcriptional regulator n=2 Tax=Spiroplasma melliferum TaxID=2134 RepID=A0AAI9X132_SPIME|nr:GntR family transcriptional regulator [Spiroplasma melliferum]KAI92678.1 transcriptional regulator [Spiroplasma melliferum KC3]QCO24288.1 transcription regulator [Spiroplasma melliferum]